MIRITIPGQPVAKGRPRMTRAGHAYTPARTRQYEAAVRACIGYEVGAVALSGPVAVHVVCGMRMPTAWSKRKKANPPPHTGRPDVDNVAKSVLDAANGLLWVDDAQIVRLTVEKAYVPVPCVTLTVEEL